jgi:hypothetical protein
MSEDPNRKRRQDLEDNIHCMQDDLLARVKRAFNGGNVSRHFDNVPTRTAWAPGGSTGYTPG